MNQKDLISILDWSTEDIVETFNTTTDLKNKLKNNEIFHPLKDKHLGMIFQKNSTRTRVSFEVGISQLGGKGLFLSSNDLQIGRGETIKDTALTLSRYLNCIMIRTFEHQDVIDLAEHASIPVINGLTNLLHPCQALADLYTMLEHVGNTDNILQSLKNKHLVFIGDGNNVANSLLIICAKLGVNFSICCPEGYEPDKNILEQSKKIAEQNSSTINIVHDLNLVTDTADVYYTDVWVSMGDEAEAKERLEKFKSFQVNQKLIEKSANDVKIMHCLPAKRGQEITDEVIDGPNSIIFDQAENRLHVQKAVMYLLMK
jgi:ornithine carbamoyltransferase